MEMTHQALCSLAVKWLQRSNSNNGHGCCFAVSEVKSGWNGEVPDAIGFRRKGYGGDGTVVVEVKVSRADFLADAKKPHRLDGGLGNWRYFMCPESMISPDELPEGWGLLWVNSRGHIKPKAGPSFTMATSKNWLKREESLQAFRHDSNHKRELFILVKMLTRIGDPEALNNKLKEVYRERGRIADQFNKQLKEMQRLKQDLSALRFKADRQSNRSDAEEGHYQ